MPTRSAQEGEGVIESCENDLAAGDACPRCELRGVRGYPVMERDPETDTLTCTHCGWSCHDEAL